MSGLIKYEAARHALAVCKNLDEVKDWADKAAAMQAYGRMAKDTALEADAAEIRIRAERRLGELLIAQKAGPGLAKPGVKINSVENDDRIPTLAEVGISKDLSSRAQKIAAVPEAEFEQQVGDWRERIEQDGARVTAKLEATGEAAQAEALAADGRPTIEEIMIEQEVILREQGDMITAFEAEDRGAELAKYIKMSQHYQREIGVEQDKNAKMFVEITELRRWRNRVVDAAGGGSARETMAAILAKFAK